MKYITDAIYINDRERVLCKDDGRTTYTAAEITEMLFALQIEHLSEETRRENAENALAAVKRALEYPCNQQVPNVKIMG